MHCPTGEIVTLSAREHDEMMSQQQQQIDRHENKREQSMVALTEKQHEELEPMSRQRRRNHMRNQLCVCNSGKKFKKCCWNKYS